MANDVNKIPTVSVVIPVYNAAPYIEECLLSITRQTFKDFEIIVIDDGSTDSSAEIILSIADSRIVFIQNEINLGLIATLNKGFDRCQGKYIARLDADDIAIAERLAVQVKCLEQNPQLAMVGTGYFPLAERALNPVYLASGKGKIQANLLFNSCFAHPSVMIRKSALSNREDIFNPHYPHAEDYELWSWLMRNEEIDNIPKPLIYYRIHENQISKLKAEEQRNTAQKIRAEILKWLGVTFEEEDFHFHQLLAENTIEWNEASYSKAIKHIEKILIAAKQHKHIDHIPFETYLLVYIADKAKFISLAGYGILRKSALHKRMSLKLKLQTLYKCAFYK